ncbi:MAG: hypothetical protein BMS9Abin28_1024 [Anaerolineae bacterium]|nr:MAG: hypothetical protein BMS9Abin28_1024 [Anaerolineae bacterium]
MWNAESSLKSLEDAVEEIESYLLSKDVIRARSGRPSLSIGLISLNIRWLEATLGTHDQARLRAVESKLAAVRDRWRVAWERKATAELRSRLNLWRGYLDDLEGRPGLGSSYPQEVRNRAMAFDLLDAAGNQPEIKTLAASLDAIDSRFRKGFQPGAFVWEQVPESAFPHKPYWFLYGRPRSRN